MTTTAESIVETNDQVATGEQTKANDFHVEEYKCLREEIEHRSQERRTTERYAIVAIAAIYSVLARWQTENVDANAQSFLFWLWWLPFAVALAGRIRWVRTRK
jgi:hypothetical protein